MGEIRLSINEKLEILDNNSTYRSTIQDVKDGEFLIDMPYSGSKYYTMHVGSLIEFFICTEKDVVKCKSIVLGKSIENNVQLIILSNPQVVERVQRREFFRLPISMEARYYLLPENGRYLDLSDVPSGYFKRMEKIYTVDISGGGIKIAAKQDGKHGQRAIIAISLPEEINILCSVIRSESYDNGKSYRIALSFENLDERLRDKVIRFIFNKLREQSKLLR
jgi:c-di-GMP-binding flagellar brake protein YcgR